METITTRVVSALRLPQSLPIRKHVTFDPSAHSTEELAEKIEGGGRELISELER